MIASAPGLVRVFGEVDRFGVRLRARLGDNRDSPSGHLDRRFHHQVALVHRQRRRLGRRAVDDEAVRAVGDLALDEAGEGIDVDAAVAKRRDQRRVRAAQEVFGQLDHAPPSPASTSTSSPLTSTG
jgi:hypothetical protein